MAKIAIFVPYPDSLALITPMLADFPHLSPLCVEYTPTDQIRDRAEALYRQGAELVLARGLQATLIRQSLPLPLVAVRATMQEIARPVQALRRELGGERPVIALVGFDNLFPDTSHFDELFAVHVTRYLAQDETGLEQAAELAVREGAQALIGGRAVCEAGRRLGVRCHFLAAGAESLRAALELADLSAQAIDLQKRNSAEINAMLDSSHSGMLRADRQGVVRRANAAAFRQLEREPGQLLGHTLADLLPTLDARILSAALRDGQENYTTVPGPHNRTFIVNLTPIEVDGTPDGVLLTLQEGNRIIEMDSELRRELFQRGFIAKYSFANLICRCPQTEQTIRLAKRIARYPAPVLLRGENGTGKGMMAQCLHNESLLRGNAFISLDCSAWLPETADTMLFGHYSLRKDSPPCMAELAENGTLYLAHVDALPYEAQYKLLSLIRGQFLHNGSNRPSIANVRVIASTSVNLTARVERGEFRSDLYYALNVLSLELPPLRQRREDILGWVDLFLDEWQKRYKRFVHLTQGARSFLQTYTWPGNLDQVSSLCERTVLLTEKRNVDEIFLRRQLEQTSPKVQPETETIIRYKDPQADRITELLRQYHGNRAQVAKELGVSKTTLWRYIKKYGIEIDYSC